MDLFLGNIFFVLATLGAVGGLSPADLFFKNTIPRPLVLVFVIGAISFSARAETNTYNHLLSIPSLIGAGIQEFSLAHSSRLRPQ